MKFINLLLLTVVLTAITYLSVIPIVAQSPFAYTDIVVHFIMYGVLAFFFARTVKLKPLWCIIIVAAYGGLMEIVQHFLPYRNMSLIDVVANLAGAIAGTLISVLFLRRDCVTKRSGGL